MWSQQPKLGRWLKLLGMQCRYIQFSSAPAPNKQAVQGSVTCLLFSCLLCPLQLRISRKLGWGGLRLLLASPPPNPHHSAMLPTSCFVVKWQVGIRAWRVTHSFSLSSASQWRSGCLMHHSAPSATFISIWPYAAVWAHTMLCSPHLGSVAVLCIDLVTVAQRYPW
jgi:hypothetical protein